MDERLKTYLFFDIECANCFDGEGKICSFGYIITDKEFNILEEKDIIINPEAEFDRYLLYKNKRGKKDCSLAYPPSLYRMQNNFPYYYKRIKKLLTAGERKIVGFAPSNDVNFLISSCIRYKLEPIKFSVFDIASIIKRTDNAISKEDSEQERTRLQDYALKYQVDTSDITAHKSVDDAKVTMRVTQALCKKLNTALPNLLVANKGFITSTEQCLIDRDKRKEKQEVSRKIEKLYNRKAKVIVSNKLNGAYSLNRTLFTNLDEALEVALMVVRNGGILKERIKGNGTIIVGDSYDYGKQDKRSGELLTSILKRKNISMLSIEELYKVVGKERVGKKEGS